MKTIIVDVGKKTNKMETLVLLFVFISTQSNLMLVYIKCKDKLELMIVTLTVVSFFF